jgi:hypothetical protein
MTLGIPEIVFLKASSYPLRNYLLSIAIPEFDLQADKVYPSILQIERSQVWQPHDAFLAQGQPAHAEYIIHHEHYHSEVPRFLRSTDRVPAMPVRRDTSTSMWLHHRIFFLT